MGNVKTEHDTAMVFNFPISQFPNFPIRYFSATTSAVITKFAIATGNKNFHPNAINWSYLKRGKVPRTQI